MINNTLKNKNCLITGATGGIGKEIAKELAIHSCNLFLTSTNKVKLTKLKNQIRKINKNINIEFYASDLTRKENIVSLFNFVDTKFPSIDILVNSAGVFMIKSIEKSTIDDFEMSIDLNLKLPFLLSKKFSKNMIKKKWGRIVMIGSSSSYSGFENGSIYCSAKHGLLGLSRALNIELKKKNVRTISVSPASTQTKMAKISTDQDFTTFLNPHEVAQYIVHVLSYDNEMIVDESRLNRITMK